MSKIEKYILDPETLVVELREEKRYRGWKILAVVVSALLLFFLYLWIYVSLFGLDLPKTALLKRRNADWNSRLERLDARQDQDEEILSLLAVRDDRIYRSVYGMDEIPAATRSAGIGGVNRYAALDVLDRGNILRKVTLRLDFLEKKAYVQSKSFDDVDALGRAAGNLASCIPAIPPMSNEPSSFTLTSPFGVRSDPILGTGKMHTGMDFACPPGNPVYATGEGKVVKVAHDFYGYGNHVEIDHGYGYVTRYAHLSEIYVYEGQKLSRGDCLGRSGQSGRVTGPHLHYEVLYRHDYVNPANYMDLDIDPADYAAMVRKPRRR